jgi:type IV secretory pathway protease TraF
MEAKTRQRFSAWPSRGLRTGGLIAIGLLLGVLLFPEAVSPFVAINLTPSLPRGLYRITRLRVQPGALVTLCLPLEMVRRFDIGRWIAPGRCPGGKAPLCKRITEVGPGRAACKTTVWQVPEGEVFVRGESRNSQDSCIFGPVPVAWLREGVVPVWTQR